MGDLGTRKPVHWFCNVRPTEEQQVATDLFSTRGNLRIDAYAGAGKTCTLVLLAESRKTKGLYLAFNRSIAVEAQRRLPAHVRAVTIHSLAFRGVRRQLRYPEWKLTEKLTAQKIADGFRFPDLVSFHCGIVLARHTFAVVLLEAVRRFLLSADDKPLPSHTPRFGVLAELEPDQFASFAEQTASQAGFLWRAMSQRQAGLPLGHDGYLKQWALSDPHPRVDYLLVDEAQDLNPVLLHALRKAECQIVYAGDPFQQIYEWRGAVNAMEQVHTPHRTLLAQSFRFGHEIAAAASIVLRELGARVPVRGEPTLSSHVGRVLPNAVLARSNAGVIGNVLAALSKGKRCFVLGGTAEMERLLLDVARIQAGQPATSPEFFGFTSWKDVLRASSTPEGEHLRPILMLIQQHGANRILQGLAACEKVEGSAELVCSTTHRAKGREWGYVRLDDDFEAGFGRAARSPLQGRPVALAAEMRLLYVALTRGRLGVQLPRDIGKRFGIRNTTNEVLGGLTPTRNQQERRV